MGVGEDVCFYLVAHCSGRHWGRWGQSGMGPCSDPWGRVCRGSLADQNGSPGPEPASYHKACRVRVYLQYTGIRKTTTIKTSEHWADLESTELYVCTICIHPNLFNILVSNRAAHRGLFTALPWLKGTKSFAKSQAAKHSTYQNYFSPSRSQVPQLSCSEEAWVHSDMIKSYTLSVPNL